MLLIPDDATRVVFRIYPDGEVLAALLDVPANSGRVTYYVHHGQHGEGSWRAIVDATRPATPEEYAPLYRELSSKPYVYRLIVRKRRAY